MVREHGDAIDAVDLASRLGLHVTTVRFHLDSLCDEGKLERTRMNRGRVGRPRTGYRAVEERLDYRVLAEVLAMELGQTAQARARGARSAGRRWAERIMSSQNSQGERAPGDPIDRGAVLATEIFDRIGFGPDLAAQSEPTASLSADAEQVMGRERVIRLHACPVRDLAREHPEVICGIHLGLLQGLVEYAAGVGGRSGSRSRAVTARLEPFVEQELCIARLAAPPRPA
ncbi:helix-turn-helix transcriptional regulator [Mycolicibacterium sp. XJ1819]